MPVNQVHVWDGKMGWYEVFDFCESCVAFVVFTNHQSLFKKALAVLVTELGP